MLDLVTFLAVGLAAAQLGVELVSARRARRDEAVIARLAERMQRVITG
jgi:hypothetical protein